jgi:hypothetical protein
MQVIRESQKGKGKTLSGRFHVEERFTVDLKDRYALAVHAY